MKFVELLECDRYYNGCISKFCICVGVTIGEGLATIQLNKKNFSRKEKENSIFMRFFGCEMVYIDKRYIGQFL